MEIVDPITLSITSILFELTDPFNVTKRLIVIGLLYSPGANVITALVAVLLTATGNSSLERTVKAANVVSTVRTDIVISNAAP